MRMCRSPKLIAACHVLLRLLMPRHSPCALLRLIYWFSRIMQAPFGFPSVEIVTHCFPQFASNFCLLLPCLSFALCSVFNVQMVGQSGLEPPTSRLSVVCSSQLSYWPIFFRSPGALASPYSPFLVEISGFEPLTSCLQGRRSPS